MVEPKTPTMPKRSVADLERELSTAYRRVSDVTEQLDSERRRNDEQQTELRTVRAERAALRKSNDVINQERISHASDVARLGGMLDMLREMGIIPKPEAFGETRPFGKVYGNGG